MAAAGRPQRGVWLLKAFLLTTISQQFVSTPPSKSGSSDTVIIVPAAPQNRAAVSFVTWRGSTFAATQSDVIWVSTVYWLSWRKIKLSVMTFHSEDYKPVQGLVCLFSRHSDGKDSFCCNHPSVCTGLHDYSDLVLPEVPEHILCRHCYSDLYLKAPHKGPFQLHM